MSDATTDQSRDRSWTPQPAAPRGPAPVLLGPARDFAAFCKLERERRRSSDESFDPQLLEEAMALVLARLGGTPP